MQKKRMVSSVCGPMFKIFGLPLGVKTANFRPSPILNNINKSAPAIPNRANDPFEISGVGV